MSVLIKGYEMPKDGCKDCAMVQRGKVFDTCPFLKQEVNGNVERGGKPNECPLVDVPERKVGKWIRMEDADGVYWVCGECGEHIPRVEHYDPQFDLFPRLKSMKKTHFCPNCGTYMIEESKNG